MTRQGRRRLYLIGGALLVAALVGGRWLAVEIAERAWDRSFAVCATARRLTPFTVTSSRFGDIGVS